MCKDGSSGDGFYFHGRNLVIEDNVAIDCGFMQHIRSDIYATRVPAGVLLMPPETAKLDVSMTYHRCGLVDVRRNQIYGSDAGFRMIKNGDGLQHHDMRNRLYRIETYNCLTAIHITYVTKYSLVRPTIWANRGGSKWDRKAIGIFVGGRASETVIVDGQVVGYPYKTQIGTRPDKEQKGPTDVLVVGGNITSDDIYFEDFDGEPAPGYDPNLHKFVALDDMQPGRLEFTQKTPGILPLPDQLGGKFDYFYLKGARHDSLADEDLELEVDAEPGANGRASAWYGQNLLAHLANGYYTTTTDYQGTPAGTKVLKLTDLFVDRHTNDFILYPFLVSIPHDYGTTLGPELGEVDPTTVSGPTPVGNPPQITAGPTVGPSPVTGTTATASVTATDPDGDDGSLRYAWQLLAGPIAAPAPSFSPDDSTSAATTTIGFGKAGSYQLQVTVTYADGQRHGDGRRRGRTDAHRRRAPAMTLRGTRSAFAPIQAAGRRRQDLPLQNPSTGERIV